MSDQETTPGVEPQERQERGTAGRRLPSALLWVCLFLLVTLAAIQVAGVLLRDRLEGRRPTLARGPAATPELSPSPTPEPGSPTRFGPEVREVEVAPPLSPAAGEVRPAAPPPAPAELPAASSAPLKPALVHPQPELQPAEKAGAEAVKAPPPRKPQAKSPGTHALEVDTFLSQRYLHEAEQRLSSLGLPYFRKEITRKGAGQRLAISAPDGAARQKALQLLESKGFAFRENRDAFEVHFYYPEEARTASAEFSRLGLTASLTAVDGNRPIWKLYAGPFSQEEAREAQKRLSTQGIQSVLGKRP